jgi:hypothetical protein
VLNYIESLAARQLSKSDRRFWQLAGDDQLGRADYKEFLFHEAVEALERFNTPDPAGHVLLWLQQGYLSGSPSIHKAEGAPFASTDRGVFSLRVTERGRDVAKLGRPQEAGVRT